MQHTQDALSMQACVTFLLASDYGHFFDDYGARSLCALRRAVNLVKYKMMRDEKMPREKIAAIAEISRATFYDQWPAFLAGGVQALERKSSAPTNRPRRKTPEPVRKLVLWMRDRFPQHGKEKIYELLLTEPKYQKLVAKALKGLPEDTISQAAVGRIISAGLADGTIKRSRAARKLTTYTRPEHRLWAKRAPFKKYSEMEVGERVQFDHMTVTINGRTFKQFSCWDRVTKFACSEIYYNADSATARKFLRFALKSAPFKIRSIQVDGGSEFMGDFENECFDLKLEQLVIPPKSPKINGGVERMNRTEQDEIWPYIKTTSKSIHILRRCLRKGMRHYNHVRPHKGIANLSPMAYIKKYIKEAA